jgi:predicted nucleic acid-binding Zn ribbon protein
MSSSPECKVCGDYISHGPVICEKCQEKHDAKVRQDERDKIYKRLEAMIEVYSGQSDEQAVPWSDIDCLFAELKDNAP